MYFHKLFFGLLLVAFFACSTKEERTTVDSITTSPDAAKSRLVILGTFQDGGSPHIGCQKSCCAELFGKAHPERKVVSLGLIEAESQQKWLFEATADITSQIRMLHLQSGFEGDEMPDGIFLTHAHIGHYAGLMYLGREALGADSLPVFSMPRMRDFLTENGPWSQLVSLGNIQLKNLKAGKATQLSKQIAVTPFLVPHRDEFSETVGYHIAGPQRSALFIPDIDKWEKWDQDIVEMVKSVDLAFLDATFFDAAELNHRDMSEIPHPFVVESMSLFDQLPVEERKKIHFIHLNHSNPLADSSSIAYQQVKKAGYGMAKFGQAFPL